MPGVREQCRALAPATVTGPETVCQELFLADATPGGFVLSPSG